MRYVSLDATADGITGMIDPAGYLRQLPVLAPALPAGAREFATDGQHYDFYSRRCVKDLKIARIQFSPERAGLEIGLRHNCWKHEEDLVLCYGSVRGLEVAFTYSQSSPPWTVLGEACLLGEVILDEILPHEHGCSHEIACHTGTLTVVCQDLTARWIPADCPDKPAGKPQAGGA
jgi:hypothetical protein